MDPMQLQLQLQIKIKPKDFDIHSSKDSLNSRSTSCDSSD